MPITGALRGALVLAILLLAAAGAGRVIGVGPFAGAVPPDQVTDPGKKAPVSEATSGTGVDVNPLTFVDRLRSCLTSSGRPPTSTDVA